VAASVVLWGCSGVVIKAVPTSGLVTTFFRLWFAIPLLWMVALSTPPAHLRFDRAWLAGSVLGGLLFGGHQLLFFNALKLTSVANVTIIGALQPVIVLVAAGPLFGERPSAGVVGWSLVALAGTSLVVLGAGGTSTSPLGDALAVANLLVFTGYLLASKWVRSRVEPSAYVLGMTTVAGLVVLIATVVGRADVTSPRGGQWLVLLFLAVGPGTLGHWLLNWAHAHVPAFAMATMLLAVPVLSTAGAFLFLGEGLESLQMLGGLVVLLAVGAIVGAGDRDARRLAESVAETDAP